MIKKETVTLKDIAIRAGISVNSVSRALKGKKNISAKTIARVKQIANELGYIPDSSARSLRKGYMDVIAVVYDNLTNPYYSMMLSKINLELTNKNYEAMIFVDHHSMGYLSCELTRKIIGFKVAAIITFIEPTEDAAKIINENKIPTILIGRDGRKNNICSVFSNDEEGGRLAASVLIDKGCRNLCYYTQHNDLLIDKLRLKGFKEKILSEGFDLPDENIIIGTKTVDPREELQKLVKRKNIDGIFAFSDLLAFEVLKELFSINKNKDIKVIGYDNLKDSIPYLLKVDSVAPDPNEVIKKSLDILIKQIKQKTYLNSEYEIIPIQYFED